jgi:hypothetical protein
MAMPEACEVTLEEGAFPKGGWDRVAILGPHEQPNQPQSGSWSPHLPPKRQLYSRSHLPDYLISPRTSAATIGWAGLTPRSTSLRRRDCGPLVALEIPVVGREITRCL